MKHIRHKIIGLTVGASAALALAAPASGQSYDQASLEVLEEATASATGWFEGKFDSNAPKVTYDGPPITLRTSLHTPASAYSSKVWKQQFDVLERISGGKIVPDHRWGMTVHHVSKGFEANRDNLTDTSPCWSFYKSNSFPMLQALFLPGVSPNAAVHAFMAEKLYPKYFRDEYERQGVYMGRIRATTPYIYFNKKAITSLADLKGLKVRTGGGIHADVQAALGAVPTSMSSAEFYTAFQRGIIDSVSLSDSATETFKIHEIATHRTYVNLSRVILEMCFNKKWVDALPADLRTLLNYWGRSAAQYDTQINFILGGGISRKIFRDQGMAFDELSAEEDRRWHEAVEPVIAKYVEETTAKGLPAKELLADMKKLVAEYGKMTPNEIMMDTIKNPIHGIIPGT
jgi:TRAP-type C4-dicarboxylate transport system substrate-binding protein